MAVSAREVQIRQRRGEQQQQPQQQRQRQQRQQRLLRSLKSLLSSLDCSCCRASFQWLLASVTGRSRLERFLLSHRPARGTPSPVRSSLPFISRLFSQQQQQQQQEEADGSAEEAACLLHEKTRKHERRQQLAVKVADYLQQQHGVRRMQACMHACMQQVSLVDPILPTQKI
ncbi:hypothetical protein Efla_004594 [Eimeria flavescens]